MIKRSWPSGFRLDAVSGRTPGRGEIDMLAKAKRRVDGYNQPQHLDRVSDEDLLRAVRRDLASVYTEVLRKPIPDRLAMTLAHLEAAVRTPAR